MTTRGPDIQAVRALGVRRMTVDRRAVRPGETFGAYPGESCDGRDYIAQAVRNGASSVLWDVEGYAWNRRVKVPNLSIAQLRSHAGVIASETCNALSEAKSRLVLRNCNILTGSKV